MSRFVFCLIALISLSSSVSACLNGASYILKNGELLYADYDDRIPRGHQFLLGNASGDKLIREFDSLYHATKDLDYLSDKGVVLTILGRYQEAINLFLRIERIAPGRYTTAANLGTAYELAGNNKEALVWINRAIAIDPTSHDNSEWIHATILEAKIKGPSYINTRHLLRTDFGTGKIPVTTMSREELNVLANALYYQLHERMSFVKPPDSIVAHLLHTLGDIEYLLNNRSEAKEDYTAAIQYGYDANELPEAEPESVQQSTAADSTELPSRKFPVVLLSAAGVATILIGIFIRRKRKNKF